MLTPYFEIRQTETEIILLIHTPYANVKETEIYAEGNDFRFYSSPYYLRLHFPGNVQDIEEPCARYLVDEKQFEVKLQKCTVGEHFPDLDLIGGLLAPKKKVKTVKPDIQVISSVDYEDEAESGEGNQSDSDSEDEWFIEQQVAEPNLQDVSLLCNSPRYGFANQTSNAFARLGEEFYEIVNLRDIDATSERRRDELMHDDEEKCFSDDHYLSDLMEPECIQPFIDFCPLWRNDANKVKLSKADMEVLKNFGNKEYLLTKDDERSALLSLFDIIFACLYDFRTTMSESSVESAWTINKLSATLSWLKIFKSPEDVVKSCLRRSLIYPLYRNWGLAKAVLQDTVIIFKAGKRHLLWLLLRIHSLFNESEPRYMLNELYIKDYCIWLQQVSDKKLNKFSNVIEQAIGIIECLPVKKKNMLIDLSQRDLSKSVKVMISLEKGDVDLDIDILEAAAKSCIDEEEEAALSNAIDKIAINNREESQSESETSDSEEDSSTVDDSSTDAES